MAHSFVDYRGNMIRIKDIDLIAAILIIITEARELFKIKNIDPTIYERQFDLWMQSFSSDGAGCIDLRLNNFLSNGEIIQMILTMIDAAVTKVTKFGSVVPSEYLRSLLSVQGITFNDYESKFLLNTFEELKRLITLT